MGTEGPRGGGGSAGLARLTRRVPARGPLLGPGPGPGRRDAARPPRDLGALPGVPRPRCPGGRASAEPRGLTAVVFAPQENPALIRWAHAKSQNVYPTFRPTPRTSFLGAVYGLGPLLFWIFVLKADRVSRPRTLNVSEHHKHQLVKCTSAWSLSLWDPHAPKND